MTARDARAHARMTCVLRGITRGARAAVLVGAAVACLSPLSPSPRDSCRMAADEPRQKLASLWRTEKAVAFATGRFGDDGALAPAVAALNRAGSYTVERCTIDGEPRAFARRPFFGGLDDVWRLDASGSVERIGAACR
jgi:hypothetical protein